MMNLPENEMIDLLKKMYERSSEIIFFLNGYGKVMDMNPAARRIVDLQEVEHKFTHSICEFCKGYTNNTEVRTCFNCYLKNPEEDFSSFQIFLKTKTDGILPFAASYQVIDDTNGIRILMLRNLTKQLKTQEELYQNKMTKHIIKAQEDERKRISRELHDSVTQELLNSLVELRLLKYLNNEEDKMQKIKQTEKSLTRLLDDVRNLSVELRPSSLDDLGLEAAFRSHFKWLEKNYGLVVHFIAELNSKRYENEIETVIYRICQESVFNALKYAQVDEVNVRLFEESDVLQLLVEDAGVGFDLRAEAKGTGLGLYGMRERAEFINGKLTIVSEIGKGTKVHLQVPVAPEQTKGLMS